MANKLGVGLLALVFAVTFAAPAGAQTATTTSAATQIAALLEQITALQQQLRELQARQQDLRQELRDAVQLTRTLARGMSGDDVEELQQLLASDPELYPEGLVTGFFGPLTEAAVERLQARFGIEQVGIVGPITRGTINQLFRSLNKGKGSLNRGPGNIFDVLEVDEDDDAEDVDLSEFTPGMTGIMVCHVPPGNPAAAKAIAVGGPAVQAHLGHGDTLGSCGDAEDEGDEDEDEDEDENEDETAPEISDIDADAASTTATITWTTDEDSDSTVWYSTDSGFDTDDSGVEEESDSDLVTSHSIELEGLDASTTYYFIVGSEDEEGNVATSTEQSFETD